MQPEMKATVTEEAATAAPAEPKIDDPIALAEAARAKAAQLMAEKKYTEAKKALEEAEELEARETRGVQAEALRAQAAQLMAERKFAEAKKALADADALEAESVKTKAHRVITNLRTRIQAIPLKSKKGATPAEPVPETIVDTTPVSAETTELEVSEPVEESGRIVSLYSKIAAGVGILPGGLLNFAAILAVDVIMVWKIAKAFGQTESKEKVRGSVLSLIGAVIPTSLGHGAGLAIAAIPAVIAGAVVYFLVTPVLAYALTRAVGNTFIMHFESGGTLLTFDPKKFRDYFVKELQDAGATRAPEPSDSTAAPATSVA